MDRREAYRVCSDLYLHFRPPVLRVVRVADMLAALSSNDMGTGWGRDNTNHDVVLLPQMSDNTSACRSNEYIIRGPRFVPEEASLADPYYLASPWPIILHSESEMPPPCPLSRRVVAYRKPRESPEFISRPNIVVRKFYGCICHRG